MLRPYDNVKYENIKMGKFIGSGMMGTLYVGTLDGKKYAVKTEKIIPKMMKKYSGVKWRELYFYTQVAPKYKKQLKIYAIDYKIIDDCQKFKHPATDEQIKNIPEEKVKKLFMKLRESKYCCITIFPLLKGDNLHEFFMYHRNKITPKSKLSKPKIPFNISVETKHQFYRWFIDILKQIKLLHSLGYAHNDIHTGNIMIIDGTATLIDYGQVSSKKWNEGHDYTNDFISLIYFAGLCNHNDEHKRMNTIHGDKKYPFGHDAHKLNLKKFLATKESKIFIGMCDKFPILESNNLAFYLCEIMMPDFIMKLTIPKKYIDQIFWTQAWLINFDDILFYLKNILLPNGIDMVIKKLSEKL